MIRPILTLAVLLLLATCIVGKGADTAKNPSDNQQPYSSSTPNVSIQPVKSIDEKSSSKSHEDVTVCQRLLNPLIANWPLVLVGTIGIWAAWRTLTAIQQQGDAIEKSERAWMATIGPFPKTIEKTSDEERILYCCGIKNVGLTPARILEVCTAFEKNTLENIPKNPDYTKGKMQKYNKILVIPDEVVPLDDPPSQTLTETEFEATGTEQLFLYGYGYVKYLDSFSKNDEDFRETRFCHQYLPLSEGIFKPFIKAPASYHEAT